MDKIYLIPLVYLLIISLITAVATCLDKLFAKKGLRRISEKALITLALFGGSFAEYAVMKTIRHKTLHKKFMVGLPLIMLMQAAVAGVGLYYLITNNLI